MFNFKTSKKTLALVLVSILLCTSLLISCSPKANNDETPVDDTVVNTQTDAENGEEAQQPDEETENAEIVVEEQDNIVNVSTPDELVSAFENLKADTIISINADLDMTGKTIKAVNGRTSFTLNGSGYTISNLTSNDAALFVARTGSAAFVFNDVNLKNCSVTSPTNHAALFVGDGDKSGGVVISNCTAEDCTVDSGKYAAAFVAYSSGYKLKDVVSVFDIVGCSVIGGSITGKGSTGAALGHSGSTAETINNITDLTVKNVAINGEDAEHTGIAVGTANIGITNITNVTIEGVTGNFDPAHQLYGRYVLHDTGKLNIDGTDIQ